MFYTRFLTLLSLGHGLLQVAEGAQRIDTSLEDCDLPFAEAWASGQSTGWRWCASQIKKGYMVSGIRVYNSGDRRQHYDGIDIIYENGDWTSVGKTELGDNVYLRELYWDPHTTTLKRVDMQPKDLSYNEVHYGLRVILSDGREIYGGSSGPDNRPENIDWDKHGKTPVHGNLVGIRGMGGDKGIEQIEFLTLNAKTKSSRIHDIEFTPTFDELNARPNNEDKGVRREVVSSGHYMNDRSTKDITVHFKDTVSLRETTSWTHSWQNSAGLTVGQEITFNTGMDFKLFKVGGESVAKWEVRYDHSDEHSRMDTKDNVTISEYSLDATVEAGKAVRIWGYSNHGTLDVSWKATMTITFDNEKTLDLPISGTLKGTRYSDAWFHVEDETLEEARAAIKAGEPMFDDNGEVVPPELIEDRLSRRELLDRRAQLGGRSIYGRS